MQARICELHLVLDAGCSRDATPGRVLHEVFQERRLADPRLSAHDQDLALACSHARQQSIQSVALVSSTAQHMPRVDAGARHPPDATRHHWPSNGSECILPSGVRLMREPAAIQSEPRTSGSSHRCGCWSPAEPACSAARCGPRGGRGPRARDARARGARPLRPLRGRRRGARRRWRPAPGDADPLDRADLGSGGVARERSASHGRFEDPRRHGDRGRSGGLRPTDGHVRLPVERPGIRGHADRRGPADPALRARRRGGG